MNLNHEEIRFEAVKQKVLLWARERQIIPYAKPYTQIMKAISEAGELADAIIKDDHMAVKDAIGDAMVCLIIFSALIERKVTQQMPSLNDERAIGLNFCGALHELQALCTHTMGASYMSSQGRIDWCVSCLDKLADCFSFTLTECLEHSYDIIKDRKGITMPNGVFVKHD